MTHHRAKLDEAKVREIRRRHAAGESQHRLSGEFHVSQPCISQIVHRDTWRQVDAPAPPFDRKDWEKFVRKMVKNDAEDREAMLFVLAGLHMGLEDIEALAKAAGCPLERAQQYAEAAKENGVYRDGKWCSDTDVLKSAEHMNMVLVMWTLAVRGIVVFGDFEKGRTE